MTPAAGTPSPRPRLTRERVLEEAMCLADEHGLDALTIRVLASRLGVKPMAIYHHVASKGVILDGITNAVLAQVEVPIPGQPWRAELARQARSMRAVLRRHPWALALLDSRTTPGDAVLTLRNAQLGTLIEGGCTVVSAGSALALLDAFVYGFVLQEVALPFDAPDEPALVEELAAAIPQDAYPYLATFAVDRVLVPGYDFGDEFEVGLEVVLDGIASMQ